jgi:hypothetical protein
MMGYPTQTRARPTPQQRGQQERAEVLTGTRSTPDKKAITREDAGAFGAVKLKAAHVSASPTAADFNALVDDMRALAAVLNTLGARFTGL